MVGLGDEPQASDADGELERALLERLTTIAQAVPGSARISLKDLEPPALWTAALDDAYEQALARGRPLDRVQVFQFAQRARLPPWVADPARGLRDPDPVVRYVLLNGWPAGVEVPAAVREQLRADPDEAVRQLAAERWP